MNSSEETRNERPREPTKETEVLRTSHWLLSRRGPAFLDPIFRLGDQTIRRIKSYVEKVRWLQIWVAAGGTIHSHWPTWLDLGEKFTQSI